MRAYLRALLTVAAFLLMWETNRTARATPLQFFAVDYTTSPNTLFHFADDGTLLDTWPAPQSRFASSLTTIGRSLYLAEFNGGIHEYSLDGTFVREIADLSQPGGSAFQLIESDLSGNLYSAFDGTPRTFKLDREGRLLATYSHPGISYPNGIDAAANGNVYVLNGAPNFGGIKLYQFQASGSFISSHTIPQMTHVSSIAIDESRNFLYICDEIAPSVYRYDISSGEPVFSAMLPALTGITRIFIEQQSGRLFTIGGFEVSLDGSGAKRIFTEPVRTRAVVAIPIPEPAAIAMLPFAMLVAFQSASHRRRNRTR